MTLTLYSAEPNRYPRSPNSPEEAHDYLWVAQDLWMQEDVWEWADSNPDVKAVILKNCSNEVQGCRVREGDVAQFKRCSACRLVRSLAASSCSQGLTDAILPLVFPGVVLQCLVPEVPLATAQSE